MLCSTLGYGPRYKTGKYIQVKKLFCFQENATMQVKKNKTNVDLSAIGRTIKDVGEGVVPWVNFWFSFFCVNRIAYYKVYNAAKCCTSIWQLNYIFYFIIALYIWLLMT
jgi:hypothetical protein